MATREEIVQVLRAVQADPAPATRMGAPDPSFDSAGRARTLPSARVRLLLFADEPMFREGLLRLLEGYPDLEVVGWSDSPVSAALLTAERRPDVVLAAVSSPEHVASLRTRLPAIPVLVLAPIDEPERVEQILAAGATGVLSRRASVEEVVDVLHVVRRGLHVWPASGDDVQPPAPEENEVQLVAEPLDEGAVANPPVRTNEPPQVALLTKRETEIVQLIVDGYSVKQVATRCGIAMQTAKNHIHHIMGKVGASTRLQLYAWAKDQGFRETRPLLPGNGNSVG